MNILLIAAGRRYSFVERLINDGFTKIFSIEKDLYCPISKIKNVTIIQSNNNVSDIINLCYYSNFVDIVLPLNDYWSYNQHYIGLNTNKIIGNKNSIFGYNKKSFEKFMKEKHPDKYPSPKLFKDVIIKPVFGQGSRGIYTKRFYSPLAYLYNFRNNVRQRFIKGTEFSVDSYFDKSSNFINCIVRSRDRVGNGEVLDSTMINTNSNIYKTLRKYTEDIGTDLCISGPTCFQYIYDGKNFYIMEINARFGGGSILSIDAGFNMIKIMIDEYIHNNNISSWKSTEFEPMSMKRVNYETYFRNVW